MEKKSTHPKVNLAFRYFPPGIHKHITGQYGEEGFIYQGFVQVPKFETEKGHWSVVVGSWVIGDKPSGICLRESNTAVTTNTSVFCCHVIQPQAPSVSDNTTNEHLPV